MGSKKCSSEILINLLSFIYTYIVFFRFSSYAILLFSLINALVYVSIDRDIHKGRMKNDKKKNNVGSSYKKYGKFWSISLEHFVERKRLISEKWSTYYIYNCTSKMKDFVFQNQCFLIDFCQFKQISKIKTNAKWTPTMA